MWIALATPVCSSSFAAAATAVDTFGAAHVAGPVDVDAVARTQEAGHAAGHVDLDCEGAHSARELRGDAGIDPALDDRCVLGDGRRAQARVVDRDAGDAGGALVENPDARGLAGQPILAARDLQPVVEPPEPAGPGGPGGYEIGEEHPDIRKSDAVFEARKALELGALELVLGRIGSPQLAGYRLLDEATVPYLDGDRLTDAAGYTEANAAFHDYLFTLTGNEHLLAAYQRLGVRSHMDTTLRSATWIHPRCAQDHLDIVEAVAAGDHDGARTRPLQDPVELAGIAGRGHLDIGRFAQPRSESLAG